MTGALLLLAVRFALRGRDALIRTGLIATATGLAVALLLLAVCVPGALAARDARGDVWRFESGPSAPSPGSLVAGTTAYSVDGTTVTGLVVHPDDADPQLPAGVTALPGDGRMLVSPALRSALAAPGSAELRAALPYAIAGVIGPAGLLGPTDARYLAVDDRLVAGSGTAERVVGFGAHEQPEPLDAVLALLLVVGVLILLLPVGVVVAIAARFGAERRDLRLASIRLLGVSGAATTRLAVAEALIAAAIGDALGVGVFLIARQGLAVFSIDTLSVFPSDAMPPVPLAGAVLVVAPLLVVGSTLLSLRATVIEPLGVARRTRSERGRVWWRLAPLLAAGCLLGLSVGRFSTDRTGNVPVVAGGVALLLGGALLLLPWLTERLAAAVRGGTVSWQFATARVAHGSSAARMTGAITVVLAGAIALQMLFAGLSGAYTSEAGIAAERSGLRMQAPELPVSTALELGGRLRRADAGSGAVLTSLQTGFSVDGVAIRLHVVPCADLARIARVASCTNGDVFTGSAATARLAAGRAIRTIGGSFRWTAPARLMTLMITASGSAVQVEPADLFATPAAVSIEAADWADVQMYLQPRATAAERVAVIAAGTTDPLSTVEQTGEAAVARPYSAIQRGLTVGLILVLLLISGVLLVSVGDQLRERRQTLATLAAVGMPRSVMVRSILWENALPVVVGVVLAVVTGLALGSVLLAIVSREVTVDPSMLAASAAAALTVPLLVSVLSLPAAARSMRPDGLRAE